MFCIQHRSKLVASLAVWLLFSAALRLVFAQKVDSIGWIIDNTKLIVTYQLDREADIRMRVSIDGGHVFSTPLENLQGDVGKGVKPGRDKRIISDNLLEIRGIEEWKLVFKVEVDDGSAVIYLDTLPIVMMPVEGGTFQMGCTQPGVASNDRDEAFPAHEVTLSSYYMSQYEVTQRLWNAVMDENTSLYRGNDSLPVDQVSWSQAQIFIARLSQLTGYSFHLPTEAQWEYAARGGQRSQGFIYPGTTNQLADYVFFCGNSSNRTQPVGRKQPNELGLYDMGGNVAEWCSDWAGTYSDEPQTNPRGPKRGENRILRGGSINSPSWTCSVHDRSWYLPDYSFGCYGFRIALDNLDREID